MAQSPLGSFNPFVKHPFTSMTAPPTLQQSPQPLPAPAKVDPAVALALAQHSPASSAPQTPPPPYYAATSPPMQQLPPTAYKTPPQFITSQPIIVSYQRHRMTPEPSDDLPVLKKKDPAAWGGVEYLYSTNGSARK